MSTHMLDVLRLCVGSGASGRVKATLKSTSRRGFGVILVGQSGFLARNHEVTEEEEVKQSK
ncbi:hypothetical protein PIB30_080608, partial [Stylosanthes scabra]|nr:hypothetical protein [Stylosanthes scabra]